VTGDGPGAVIRVSELGADPDGAFRVRVSFGDRAEYEVQVVDPTGTADPAELDGEKLLAWYFEQHLRYPFLDKDRERQAVAQIATYGEALFAQVLSGKKEVYADYRKLRDRGLDGCRIEISGSAALHRLHWEALRDPDLSVPLAMRLPVTRRVTGLGSKFDPPGGRPTLNVLVVTARPDGPRDVGYRTVSRPLLAKLRTAALPVTVDLVRPGTWEALRAHLREATEARGSGWYHVVHFDLHGAFEDYAALEEGRRADRLLFGPGVVAPFEGKQGFVFFETDQVGQAGPVAAGDVAALLAEHRVPVAVLNACQSAMQTASEAGLAQRLAEAGVPVALGMAYSVTVSAAEQAMPVLYGKITAGADLTTAVQAARRDLHDRKARRAYFGQELDLADWMLPVLFAQYPLQLQLRSMTAAEHAEFLEEAAAVGEEPSTEYGFVGRDLDIQAIEHRILGGPDSNMLLVQGMAGAGKSTLLAHLAWWWPRTGLVNRVFRFSYEDRAWTAGQIIRDIRAQLLSPAQHAQADTMSEAAQAEQVAGLLRATRHLLILDNTESITDAPAAIPHALNPAEQRSLKNLLTRLRGGRTLVLLGSRENETWLGTGAMGPGVYPLPGLDPQAASDLVERILKRHHATGHRDDTAERDALNELVTLLGGYPLPLTVVLPVLALARPSAVLEELKAGNETADPAGLIRHAVEYSHGKLNPALQTSLQLLAPFTAVIATGQFLENYHDLLLQDPAFQALGTIDLAAALDQAVAVGLAAPHPGLSYLVQVQPVLPWFLRSRLADQPALKAATSRAHYRQYCRIANELRYMLAKSDNPQDRANGQAAARAEYANLTTALAHGLRTGEPIAELIRMLDVYLDQAEQHDTRRQLLDSAIAVYPEAATQDQQRELALLHSLACASALAQHRLDDARTHQKTALLLQEASGDRQQQSRTYRLLGRVAEGQRRYDEAEASYRQALDISLEFGDRDSAAATYHHLGMLAEGQRRYDEAEASYRQALDIFLEFGDRNSAAATYHHLGTVAAELGRDDEAEASYQKSLDIKLDFGDRHRAVGTYFELGKIAQKQHRYDEAEASYRQALDSCLEFGDRHRAALAFAALGTIAQKQHRYDEAEASYQQALDRYRQSDDRHAMADIYHNFGAAAQEQHRYDEAEASYQQALDIYLEFGDRHSAAGTHHELGTVAEKQGRYADAQASYQKALEVFRDSDPLAAARTATSLGNILASLGQAVEATGMLLYALGTRRQQTGNWDSHDLAWLHRGSAALGADQFVMLIKAVVPPALAADLTAAIEQAPDPADTAEMDEGC
jgi:tetratricopeptide (TPR) repeat protein